MSVCLSTATSQIPHVRISSNFLCIILVAVARSSSNGSAVRYILPVLWMTSCFHVMEQMGQNQTTRFFFQFSRWRHRERSMPSPTSSCCSKEAYGWDLSGYIHGENNTSICCLGEMTISAVSDRPRGAPYYFRTRNPSLEVAPTTLAHRT